MRSSSILRYAVAAVAGVLAIILPALLPGKLETGPYLLSLAAVVAGSLYGGLGPGGLTLFLVIAGTWALQVQRLNGTQAGIDFTLFLLVSLGLWWLAARLRRAQDTLEQEGLLTGLMTLRTLRSLSDRTYAVG